jgi:hypothetical protein
MPEKETIQRARQDERQGKSPSTQAGEFAREEIHHVREGKHGVRSPQQSNCNWTFKSPAEHPEYPAHLKQPVQSGHRHRLTRGTTKREQGV